MNFKTIDQLSDIQRPVRGISYNRQESYPDIQRKRYIPQIMQKQGVTNQNVLPLNRNRMILGASEYRQNINGTGPSTSTENYVPHRTNANKRFGISEVSVQGNPESNPRSAITSGASSVEKLNVGTKSNTVSNFKIFGSTENEKMFIFTGTVERVMKWNKIFRNHFCYYEVIASVISIQEGSVNTQRIMLLRDKKGPILQVVYYNTTHIDIENFHVEQVLRCLGRMGGPNILNAISIRTASQEEIETLQRHCLACDQAISHFLSV